MSRDWKNGNNSHFGLSDRTIYGIVAIPAGFEVVNMTLDQLISIAFVGISIDCPSIFLEIVFCTTKLSIFFIFEIACNQFFKFYSNFSFRKFTCKSKPVERQPEKRK